MFVVLPEMEHELKQVQNYGSEGAEAVTDWPQQKSR